MKIVFTVELDNRHQHEADLLQAVIKDSVVDFNRRTRAEANMMPPRMFGDDADVLVGRRVPLVRR
jgi:hypothetical protein